MTRRRPAGADRLETNEAQPPANPSDGIAALWLELDSIAHECRQSGETSLERYRLQAHLSLNAVVSWMLEHPLLGAPDLITPLHMLTLAISSEGARHPILSPSKREQGRPPVDITIKRAMVRRVLAAVIVLRRGAKDSVELAAQKISDDLREHGLILKVGTIVDWFGKYETIQNLAEQDADAALALAKGSSEGALAALLSPDLMEVLLAE